MIRNLLGLRRLSRREKFAVWGAMVAFGVFVLVQFVVFPVIDERQRLKRTVQFKTKVLEDMQRLKAEFEAVTKSADQIKRQYAGRPKGFTLFAFLDKLARDTGIKNNIAYMKPSNTVQKNSPYKISTVEMKLQGVGLEQLTQYLYAMETSPNRVTLKRASFVKRGKEQGAIDILLQVETIEI